MATTTTLLQHPLHDQHPLELRDFTNDSIHPDCYLCYWRISADGYACLECEFYAHRACAEAPPQIDPHPLHTDHPLTLIRRLPPFRCDVCGEYFNFFVNVFRCDVCDFDLCIRCALSTLSDRGGTQGKTPQLIKLPLHIHTLTSFSTRHDFIGDSNCVICKASVEGNGYACLRGRCEFLIHKRCIQDLFGDEYDFNLDISCASSTLLDRGGFVGKTPKWIALPLHHHLLTSFSTRYDFIGDSNCMICKAGVGGDGDGYACLHWQCEFLIHKRCIGDLCYTDGTKAPQVYHGHRLETFLGEDTGSSRCGNCGSDESREFIGCEECQVFYCRNCVQVPESIQYPRHPDHTLVLLISSLTLDNDRSRCDSCLVYLKGKLCYGCPSCEFFVDLRCALQVLAYCEEGMSAKIKLSWHEHQLHLCHRTEYDWRSCSYCEDRSAGPMYVCKEEGRQILVHKRCTEFEVPAILQHPHHPDHPLTLCQGDDFRRCEACCETILDLYFSCELCAFYLHAKCAARFPTRKHPLHEHELLHLEEAPLWICNRCRTSGNPSLFRCVPCNFNLHEECMELPLQVVNSKIHWHPLTLHETYIEDDSGEYYCDQCEKRRDEQMGVYVCLQCSARWAYHIECVFPELQKVCVKDNAIAIERLTGEIAIGEEEVLAVERKLDEMKRELEEKRKKRAALIIIEKTMFDFEMTFATNYLGHFLLTKMLTNKMIETARASGIQGRIVNVSSGIHGWFSGDLIREYDPARAYALSKLANVLHTRELSIRLKKVDANVTANCVNPGIVRTRILRYREGFVTDMVYTLTSKLLKTIPQAAATTCYVATRPRLTSDSRKSFSDCNEASPSGIACESSEAARLWSASEIMTSDRSVTYVFNDLIDPTSTSP